MRWLPAVRFIRMERVPGDLSHIVVLRTSYFEWSDNVCAMKSEFSSITRLKSISSRVGASRLMTPRPDRAQIRRL